MGPYKSRELTHNVSSSPNNTSSLHCYFYSVFAKRNLVIPPETNHEMVGAGRRGKWGHPFVIIEAFSAIPAIGQPPRGVSLFIALEGWLL